MLHQCQMEDIFFGIKLDCWFHKREPNHKLMMFLYCSTPPKFWIPSKVTKLTWFRVKRKRKIGRKWKKDQTNFLPNIWQTKTSCSCNWAIQISEDTFWSSSSFYSNTSKAQWNSKAKLTYSLTIRRNGLIRRRSRSTTCWAKHLPLGKSLANQWNIFLNEKFSGTSGRIKVVRLWRQKLMPTSQKRKSQRPTVIKVLKAQYLFT